MATKKRRLIDATDGKKVFVALARPAESKGVIHMVVPISEIDKLPTVDAVEVVRGRWLEEIEKNEVFESEMVKCSVCGQLRFFESNYCPNCGAKMDGERKEK